MEIVSIRFVVLVVLSIFLYYTFSPRYRISILLILSCAFIASYDYFFCLYILAFAIFNYFAGLGIARFKKWKILYRAGIIINITQLFLFKYLSTFISPFLAHLNSDQGFLHHLNMIIAPVGISFFTLQGIGYLINISKGWEKPERNIFKFILYILFYPKLLSGPIERSNHFLPQLSEKNHFDQEEVIIGLRIALFGFFKKVVIADQLAVFVNHSYNNIGSSPGLTLWLLIFTQLVYLYFDFSGYTDIAIGIARTYGLKLAPNFERPLFAENMTMFWRRFHMSLSFWFNDYIFKQLSFKYRHWGNLSPAFAVFVTFTLFGIWHGAGLNFMVLGIIQAFAINYEYFTRKQRMVVFSKLPSFLRTLIGRVSIFVFLSGALVFFFSPDIKSSFTLFSRLFTADLHLKLGVPKLTYLVGIVFAATVLLIELLRNDHLQVFDKIKKFWMGERTLRIITYYVIFILILYFSGNKNGFVYQQF
jgi:alginate O-acetyltransferase complex protein AlgI